MYYVGKERIIIGPRKQNVSWYQLAATNKARRDERPSDLLLSWDFSWRGAGWNKKPRLKDYGRTKMLLLGPNTSESLHVWLSEQAAYAKAD